MSVDETRELCAGQLAGATSGRHRNLVITRAGRRSLHCAWIEPEANRNFDLLIAAYDRVPPCGNRGGVFIADVPGRKVQGWDAILRDFAELVGRYDRVALIDDDIACTATDIGRCFAIGATHDLQIWQPSLAWRSYVTYALTLHNPAFALRFVNFVEMMCPFFSAAALRAVRPLFAMGWESGIDLVWGSLLPPAARRLAIVDAVQVRHTREVGREKGLNGFTDRRYEDDIYDCLLAFGTKWPSGVAHGGILRGGRRVARHGVTWRTAGIFGAAVVSPSAAALSQILIHLRHQCVRRGSFAEISVGAPNPDAGVDAGSA